MVKRIKAVAPPKKRVSSMESWSTVTLGDVVAQRQELQRDPVSAGFERYLMVDHLDADRLKISRWGTIADGDLPPTFYKIFRAGQVLYPTRNPHLRRTAYADFDGICGEKTLTLESNGEVEARLLPFIFQTERFIEYATSMAIGSTNPHVRWRDIAAYEFPLPPKADQPGIADILWAVDECTVSLETMASALQEYRQSYLDSVAHEYSASQSLAPLDTAIEPGRPICYGILKPGVGVKEGIPVIKVRDYPNGVIQTSHLLLTTSEIEAPFKRSRLKSKDLIISIRGTVGRIAEVPPELDEANITQDTARLSIAQSHNRNFIRAFLESRFAQRQISSRVTGLAVQGINIGELRQIQVPLPPLSEQDQIATKLNAIARAQDVVLAHLAHQRALKAVLTNDLLGGVR